MSSRGTASANTKNTVVLRELPYGLLLLLCYCICTTRGFYIGQLLLHELDTLNNTAGLCPAACEHSHSVARAPESPHDVHQ